MEQGRRRRPSDRSARVQEAIAERLRRERKDADEAAYVHGYELYPETEKDRAMAETSARALFEALDAEDGSWTRR